jgi:hypothetical protein
MYRIRADRIVHFAGLTGAPSLWAWLLSRGRDRRRPLRHEPGLIASSEMAASEVAKSWRPSTEPSTQPGGTETDARKRYWRWLDVAFTVLWVALLLSIVGYAVVKGESALAELDGLALVATYSLSP